MTPRQKTALLPVPLKSQPASWIGSVGPRRLRRVRLSLHQPRKAAAFGGSRPGFAARTADLKSSAN
jgi:hypothetical protein